MSFAIVTAFKNSSKEKRAKISKKFHFALTLSSYHFFKALSNPKIKTTAYTNDKNYCEDHQLNSNLRKTQYVYLLFLIKISFIILNLHLWQTSQRLQSMF